MEIIEGHEIIYFNTGKNLGGAGGFQYGLKVAHSLGYKFYWLMDDDTFPEPGALKALIEADPSAL